MLTRDKRGQVCARPLPCRERSRLRPSRAPTRVAAPSRRAMSRVSRSIAAQSSEGGGWAKGVLRTLSQKWACARGNQQVIRCLLMGWSGRAPAPPAAKLARGAEDEAHAMSPKFNAGIAVIGIDIGKKSFHVVGLDRRGAIVLRQKWSRGQVEIRLANLPPCLIGMEAGVGAHHLSRKLTSLGHDARLMPAKYVRPYSRGQKNDFRDAEAIAEAVQRPTMKFVATKTAEQLDLQALHACNSTAF